MHSADGMGGGLEFREYIYSLRSISTMIIKIHLFIIHSRKQEIPSLRCKTLYLPVYPLPILFLFCVQLAQPLHLHIKLKVHSEPPLSTSSLFAQREQVDVDCGSRAKPCLDPGFPILENRKKNRDAAGYPTCCRSLFAQSYAYFLDPTRQ